VWLPLRLKPINNTIALPVIALPVVPRVFNHSLNGCLVRNLGKLKHCVVCFANGRE
jgi:hypothetical protein